MNKQFIALEQLECKTDRRGAHTYVSWAEAWAMLCEHHVATFEVHLGIDGTPLHKDANGAWVSVSVTVGEITHREWLPVMDHRNNAVPEPDAFQSNKAVKRCLAKAIALHGVGLYVYQGEDLPIEVEAAPKHVQAVEPPAPLDLKRLHALGNPLYGKEWGEVRGLIAQVWSKGRTASSKELTQKQVDNAARWLAKVVNEGKDPAAAWQWLEQEAERVTGELRDEEPVYEGDL